MRVQFLLPGPLPASGLEVHPLASGCVCIAVQTGFDDPKQG